MAEAIGPAELLNVLAQGVCVAFACDWSTVLDMGESTATALAAAGDPPSAAWLGAFVAGARAGLSRSPSEGFGLVGPRDVAWAPLDSSDLVVLAGRDGPPFRGRERRQLHQLCRIGHARWQDLIRNVGREPDSPRAAQSGKPSFIAS